MPAAPRLPLSLYIHWPYCSFLCRFCAFSKARIPANLDHARLTSAFLRELRCALLPHRPTKQLVSVYFGGGTPSLARPHDIAQILQAANELVPFSPDIEITVESNPTSAETKKMSAFKAAGVNRYSIGVQTLDDAALQAMGRLHTGADGLRAVERAKQLFARGVSLDMMFGFPGQTVAEWHAELEAVLMADHISLYQLTVEPGTPLFRDRNAARVVMPVDDRLAAMYECAARTCADQGFRRYEVSNYARNGAESIHNRGYWECRQWVGIGPSAHSRFVDPRTGKRLSSVCIPDVRMWMRQCEGVGHGTGKVTILDNARVLMEEAVVFGLRMADGLPEERFVALSGGVPLSQYLVMERVHQYVDDGYLIWDEDPVRIAPTERGMQVIDSVLIDILPDK